MRISTNTIFESGVARISELQASTLKTQQQISTGHRILTPADDPFGASRVLEVSQSIANNTQLSTNRKNANDALTSEETILGSVTSLLQDVKTLSVSAGNSAMDDTQRGFMATELSGRLNELMGYANSRDGAGNYMFAGYQVTNPAFVKGTAGVVYNGDQGQRMLQVAPSQQMALSDTGDAIFQNIKNGNGVFVTAAQSTTSATGVVTPLNTGSGTILPGSVTNAAALTGHNYQVVFTVAAGATTYDVVDTTSSTTLSAGNAYVSGQAIGFDGMQFAVSGAPASGDIFTVQPSANQSVFKVVSDLINTLRAPSGGATGQANLLNGLASANNDIDRVLDNVLGTRASIGSRMRELESLNSLGDSTNIQYTQTLGDLQDLDYAQAITTLTMQQTTLEAAQKSFVKVSGMSLFALL